MTTSLTRRRPDERGARRPVAAGRSRERNGVSRDRDGWPQMRSRITERRVQRGMIGAMREPSGYLPAGGSSGIKCDTSAYRSPFTVVYTLAKEMS